MREVSADKGYASKANYDSVARLGATPFISFPDNHRGQGGGKWAEMYHYFNFRKQEFLQHYHKRSNVESTFSMMKRKFGDFDSQQNRCRDD
jgi:transposase